MGAITVPLLSKEKTNSRTVITKANGWFAREDFDLLLNRERHRTARNDTSSYCVIIDLSNHSRQPGLISKNKYLRFLTHIIEIINQSTREIDIKCITEDYRISILLVDTTIEGSRVFLEKLWRNFLEYFADRQKLDYLVLLKHLIMVVYSVHSGEVCLRIEDIPLSLRNSLKSNESTLAENNLPAGADNDNGSKTILEEQNNFYFNWNIYSLSEEPEQLKAPLSGMVESNISPSFIYLFFKRILDISSALAGIILFLPLMVLIAISIKLTSKGPVLFKQKRVGYRGDLFTFLKFRTMYVDKTDQIHRDYVQRLIQGKNEEINNGNTKEPLYKIKNDPRITGIGHFLRKTSLDELPQFFNVLVGSMSMVGPRPPIPYEVDYYKPWHLRRITQAKPGITGLWQVYGRNKTTFDDMVRLDLKYIKNQSLWLDTKIIFETAFVLFNSKFGL